MQHIPIHFHKKIKLFTNDRMISQHRFFTKRQNSNLANIQIGWLLVLGFNATLTAKVISWRSVTQLCFLAFSHQYEHEFSFESHGLLFSHAFAEVRGENTPERNFVSTRDRTHNHQVMSPTHSPLCHPCGAANI